MNNMNEIKFSDVENGNIYKVYSNMRKKLTFQLGIAALLFLCIFGGINPAEWINLFYGINRMYLIIIIVVWVMFLVQVYCYVTKWDKRQIQEELQLQGIPKELFEENMNQGRFFFQTGRADNMFVSSQYCIISSHGRYSIVRSEDIYKLGVDTFKNGNITAHRLNCLMRNGKKYTLYMKVTQSVEIAKYLKDALQ